MAATTLVVPGHSLPLSTDQSTHSRCVEAHESLSAPLVTTWPCLTEAMYFLDGIGGWKSQNVLWEFIERQGLELHTSSDGEVERIRALMEKYSDLPMDLADASLVATAETRRLRRVFTLDSDFHVYRANDKEPFEVVP